MSELEGILAFLRRAEALKGTLRSGHISTGRQESTAEHTWRLCLMVMAFSGSMPGINMLKLMKMCIVHDLGEAIGGDVPAPLQSGRPAGDKSDRERRDLESLTESLPAAARREILDLWQEYEAGMSPEAVLAKGFDKIETILQHGQGRNPPDFDYAFNLDYGRRWTDAHPLTRAIRDIVDEDTRSRLPDRS